MSQLLSILAFAFSFFVCSAIYTIVYRRRQKKAKEELTADKPMLDDTSYIQEVQHLSGQVGFVVWQQYDILLATQPYDWWTMVDWANYVEAEELDSLDSLRIGAPGQEETELVHVYNQNKVGLKNFDRLKEEYGSLSIAGHSRTLNDDVQIVWFNQQKVLRIFTHINDEAVITRYAETLIRRTFGTPDAMRPAKPITVQK